MTAQSASVATSNYTSGRARAVRLIVLHTTESPTVTGGALAVARYLANLAVQASAHYVVDPTTIVSQVAEADTAWAAPGALQGALASLSARLNGLPDTVVTAVIAKLPSGPAGSAINLAEVRKLVREELAAALNALVLRPDAPAA